MTGNNSCGSRSIEYGNMVHNVLGIDAWLADGEVCRFGLLPQDLSQLDGSERYREIVRRVAAIATREAEEIEHRYPKVLRRVGGYNLDMMLPPGANMAQLLVGSEGTLAFSRRIELKLSLLPKHKTLGICHFPTFYQSMEAPQHIVGLKPTAVELVDSTMIDLARSNPAFRPIVDQCVKGNPAAILLVEFAGEDRDEQVRRLKQLTELMADRGLPGSVVEVIDPALQREFWEVRKAGLNIIDNNNPEGEYQAKFSIQYTVAHALVRGSVRGGTSSTMQFMPVIERTLSRICSCRRTRSTGSETRQWTSTAGTSSPLSVSSANAAMSPW
jgi:FAD/FMN-containing dehydrogenase